jgi:hypothetical protein
MKWKYTDQPDILISITDPSGNRIRAFGTPEDYNSNMTERHRDTISLAIIAFMEGEVAWLKLQAETQSSQKTVQS